MSQSINPLNPDTYNGEVIRQVMVRLAMVCGWHADVPEALDVHQLRVGICYVVEAEEGGVTNYKKATLWEIAEYLEVQMIGRQTAYELRGAIADEVGFEYGRKGSFNKPELQALFKEVVRRDFRSNSGLM